MDYYAIGQRVRRFRKAQNLSQEQLAEMVNISKTHMSHIETGNTKLSLQVFCDLASALHVSADDLLFDGRPSGKAVCTQEIANLLSRCSPSQAQVLKDLLFAAKQSMDSYMPLFFTTSPNAGRHLSIPSCVFMLPDARIVWHRRPRRCS